MFNISTNSGGSFANAFCFNSSPIPYIASDILPTIQAFVSVSPPNDIANLMLSSKPFELKNEYKHKSIVSEQV